MKKFQMKNLLKNSFILLLLILVSSCTFYGKKGFKRQNEDFLLEEITLDTFEETTLYKMKIFFYKKYYSGLLVVKTLNEKEKQVVLLTELGMKLADMTITTDGYKINHIIPPMDKKILLNNLWSDFSNIFLQEIYSQKSLKKAWKKEGQTLVKVSGKELLLVNQNNQRVELNELGWIGNINKSLSFEYENKTLERVIIQSNTIQLKVQLEKKKMDNAK